MEISERRALPGLTHPEEYLKRLSADLAVKFSGIFGVETVERYVLESYTALLRASRIKAHVAARTIRFATDRLTALAQAQGLADRADHEVLFVCEQNAGRSQMAAVLTARLSGGVVHVRSAGSMPSRELNPAVIAVMSELGLGMEEEFPKPLTDDVVQAADVVITMGCGDACPVYPGKHYQDWDLTDPDGLPIEDVRVIRDDIAARVRALLVSLKVAEVAL